MTQHEQPGAAIWIDHFVVPANDLDRWRRFTAAVMGGEELAAGGDAGRITFMMVGRHHNGGALYGGKLPDQPPLGQALPRYGFYVRQEELDLHRRRLDQLDVEASDPVRTSAGGEEGTALYFRDPDGNEYELWAGDSLPSGAMESGNRLGIGRISHAVFESRDLDRSVEFHTRYLAVDPIRSADIPKNVAVLRLAGGGRVLFQKIDPDTPTRGGERMGVHAAFTMRDEEWEMVHERLWAGLPEAPEGPPGQESQPRQHILHPPWTRQRASMVRRGLVSPRGYNFTDWDNSSFHFVRGAFAPGDTAFYEVVPTQAE